MVKNPIAAIIEGRTKGKVSIDLKTDLKGQLYLPNTHAIGKPIIIVKIVDAMA
jgi:hypothetical protein